MATSYVVDTNLYIEAQGNPAFRAALRAFLERASRRVRVSAVVLHELLVAATTKAAVDAVKREVITPFQRHLRVIETDVAVWQEAAAIYAELRALRAYDSALRNASFRHDILIAASCRRVGATLITANAKDFALIDQVRGFRFVTAFPE